MTSQGSIVLPPVAPANASTPTAPNYTLFISDGTSSTTAGGLYKKDNTGTSTAIVPTAYTDENAQDAVGTILTDTATIDFTYNDAGNAITADVVNASVTYAKMQTVAASSLVGNPTGSTAAPQGITLASDLSFSSSTLQGCTLTGDVTKTAGSQATTIANNAATNAKIADMAAATVKGQIYGAATGDPVDLTRAQQATILHSNNVPQAKTTTTTITTATAAQSLGTFTLSGNDLAVGDTFEIYYVGLWTNTTTTTTLTFQLRAATVGNLAASGTSIGAQVGTTATGTTARTNQFFAVKGLFTVTAVGAGGSVVGGFWFESAPVFPTYATSPITGAVSFALNQSIDVGITVSSSATQFSGSILNATIRKKTGGV